MTQKPQCSLLRKSFPEQLGPTCMFTYKLLFVKRQRNLLDNAFQMLLNGEK